MDQQTKDDIKNNSRCNTPLWDANTNPIPLGGTGSGPNVYKNTFIVTKENLSDKDLDVVPVESELNKAVPNRAIGIGEIGPGSADGGTVSFPVPQGFENHGAVLDTASDTVEKGLLSFDFDSDFVRLKCSSSRISVTVS